MAKQYKIKRYHRKTNRASTYRAKPHPLSVILTVVVLGGLLFVGISSYQPIYDFIMGNGGGRQSQEPEPEPQPEPQPAPEPEPEPEPDGITELRAVYLPHSVVADTAALDGALAGLGGSDINAVMIDIKTQQGTVLFQSANQDAQSFGAIADNAVSLPAISNKLKGQDLHLVVRMSAFRDPVAAQGSLDMAIHYQNGDMRWLDGTSGSGNPWLNPYSSQARGYLAALASEAASAGAVAVVLQDVQFPAYSDTGLATFGSESTGISRGQILTTFVEETAASLEQQGASLAVYLSASVAVANDEGLYGGSPLQYAGDNLVLGALPYQFANNYSENGLELERPSEDPAATVRAVVDYFERRSGAGLIVLLQGGNEADITQYTAEQLAAQTAALSQMGHNSYILYQTQGNYLLA